MAKRLAKGRAQFDAELAERQRLRDIDRVKRDMVIVLRSIADGHNDPRSAATGILKRFDALAKDGES